MKKNLWVLLSIVIVVACNKSQDNVVPANDQKVLGLVLQAPAASSSGLILLKDGRTINPVSGFNPASVKAGNKFVLSFQPLAPTGSKILNVRVISFSTASDSTFVPPPSIGGVDSASVSGVMKGTFTGTYTYAAVSNDNVGDTIKTIFPIKVVFTDNNYEATYTDDNSTGGSGTFTTSNSPCVGVNFVDPKTYPTGYEHLVLNGWYYVLELDNNTIAFWKYTNQSYSGYMLKK